ncbi:MAG TPA: hypothetical protein DCO65_01875 [Spartobacteria bacterium]|jgi:hypothetical protein|nr:hypothetical protein [Spartobacteria bacterium]
MNFRKITVVFVALFSIAIGVSAEDQSPPKVDHQLAEIEMKIDKSHISYKRGTKRSEAARPQLQQGEFALR